MAIEWTPELTVGIAEIDDDHRELLWHVNVFLEAMQSARGGAAVAPLFEFLNDFMRHHFEAEERLMRETRYAHFAAHQAEHRHFVHVLEVRHAEYRRAGPSATITTGLGELLGTHLRDHMTRADKALCDFVLADERAARG